jgi:hypothetical protein
MALVDFGGTTKVTLESVTVGYWDTDADITVMAYSGTGAPTLAGKTWGDLQLVGSGWTTVGNYGNIGTGAETVNTGIKTGGVAVSSSYWLIGAYNPLASNISANVGTASIGTGKTGELYDYIKLASVAGTVVKSQGDAPEPGTLALFGAALLGMIGLRRRVLA